MMRLQRYDMELVYTQGKYIVLADALSRAAVRGGEHAESSTDSEVTHHVNMIAETLPVTDAKLKHIAVETEKDRCLQQVVTHLKNGWPRGECAQYYNIRTELSMVKGILLRQNRIVIPQSLRQEMLKRLHEGHLGAEKCKRRARTVIYWPGINTDIDKMVSSCDTCLKHRAKQQKEPMIISDAPEEPWQKVGTDLFSLDGQNYLLVIDYLSNYPEIALLSSTSAAGVVTHMKSIFARHGIPQVVCSDNGPCYSSRDFQKFAEEYGFQHVTSSPLYPQSNGKAEKGVHIVKLLLKKAVDSQSDPYLALLSYRASPLEHGVSPAEILMGLRTTLPCLATPSKNKYLRRKQWHLKQQQKAHYDKASKGLEPLSNSDTVRLEDCSTWSKRATVLEEVNPRSYTVRTEDGQILRRNRRSLLKTKETGLVDTSTEDTDCAVSPKTSEMLPVLDDKKSAEDMHLPVLQRSKRTVKPPDRLNL
ncbi:Retrotransposable element Tf2 type 1 [Labeo rohita]|uniref:Gypsy retrotransposon integrase-like protein 1 n=1 Tax=Labeo rohita TaxID=84645 RepID=A0A498NQC2_LABRO|nr:Retrotransposable element Tf2 type 1 [Labeo rohita]RXN38539.1 Retrotransposable element Tf2 type 1 [Labeo rohita]